MTVVSFFCGYCKHSIDIGQELVIFGKCFPCPVCASTLLLCTSLLPFQSDEKENIQPDSYNSLRVTDLDESVQAALYRGVYNTGITKRKVDFRVSRGLGYILVAAWNPAERLTTRQAAKILGLSVNRVGQLTANGSLQGERAAPVRSKSKTGRWLISRDELWDYILGDAPLPEYRSADVLDWQIVLAEGASDLQHLGALSEIGRKGFTWVTSNGKKLAEITLRDSETVLLLSESLEVRFAPNEKQIVLQRVTPQRRKDYGIPKGQSRRAELQNNRNTLAQKSFSDDFVGSENTQPL